MTTLLAPPETATVTRLPRRRAVPKHMWAGFAVILSAMILNILDSTIVNVAAPAIQADLSMTTVRRSSGSRRRTRWRWRSG